jgi:hypothetical protein
MKRTVALGLALVVVLAADLSAQSRPIDTGRSTLTVYAYKSGLFSAFADDHVIRAPIAAGSISEEGTPAVEISVRSADLVALDPNLSASKRAEVQARMVGPEVLDVSRYPDITFASTSIERAGPDRWTVRGTLTIHGTAKPSSVVVTRQDDHYRGSFAMKQSDFGIKPISIVGGTVKVKDELKIEFDIVTAK